MPAFKSIAQRDKWRQLVGEGKVSQDQYDKRAKETDEDSLPERASPRKRTVGPSRSADAAKINDQRY